MINAQEWLDKHYPKEKRSETKEIYLNEPNLEGELDLRDFVRKQGIKIYISPNVDKNKLIKKNKPKKAKIIIQNPSDSLWTSWKEIGLTYQEAQQWILIGFGSKDYKEVKQWIDSNFTFQEVKNWIDAGLNKKDIEFAFYLQWKEYQPSQDLNLEELKKEFNTWEKEGKPAHEYLDIFYSKERRSAIKNLNIAFKSITGSLDLKDFTNLEMLNCYHNQLTSLNFDNCLKLGIVDCSSNELTELKLDNLNNLIELDCNSNQITNLDVSNCNKLRGLRCNNNYLENLKISSQIERYLNINSNNFPKQSLSMFSHLVNLKQLHLGNWDKVKINQDIYNRFYGSLESLKNLSKLKYLDISNTDINSGVEYLPDNWSFKSEKRQRIFYSVVERPESKLKEIVEKLDSFIEYGLCKQCKEVVKEYNYCRCCSKNTDQTAHDFKQIVQKYENLKLVPYEQFTNIEYLAEGGFGKVYKAKWNDKNKTVVLKILNNSQSTSEEFLREIANHQTLFNCNMVVKCYGISQDPQIKNYLMVMDYMKDGDLRKFLQNNFLSFEDKIGNLSHIILGLNQIHSWKLIHRDFHPGNILNKKVSTWRNPNKCYITDLGLCRPADETNERKVYGVLPYMAPEVLRGQSYTRASDVYSFGIVAYELFAGNPPYHDLAHDEFLALKICQGLRPSLSEIVVPQLLKSLIAKCWDADSKKRPEVKELWKIIENWQSEVKNKESTEFVQQYQEVIKINKQKFCQMLSWLCWQHLGRKINTELNQEEIEETKKELFKELFKKDEYRNQNKKKKTVKANKELNKLLTKEKNLVYRAHPQAIYTSRLLNFLNLPQPQNSQEVNTIFYKLTEELEDLRISDTVKFNEELKNRFKDLESKEIFITNSEEIAPIKTQEQHDWTELNSNLTDELSHQWQSLHFSLNLISQWESQGFSPHQTQDWINIGLQPTDYDFCAWLRDHKHLTSEQVLNSSNYNQLKQEYQNYQQIQVNIEQSPK